MTYVTLSLTFLAAALAVSAIALAVAASRRVCARALLRRSLPAAAIAFAMVTVLTAVFDSVLIATDIIRYDSSLISGLRIGLAPIEDFSYPLAAVLLVPSLWSMFEPPWTTPLTKVTSDASRQSEGGHETAPQPQKAQR